MNPNFGRGFDSHRPLHKPDSNTFAGLYPLKTALNHPKLGRSWTRPCCKMVQLDAATCMETSPNPSLRRMGPLAYPLRNSVMSGATLP